MTNLKTPEQISAEMFQRAMKAFNDEYDSHPINEEAEKAFLKAEADRQQHLEGMFNDVEFDMPVGTLVKVDLGEPGSQIRKEWALGLHRPEGVEEGECLLYTGWFRRDVKVSNEYAKTMLEPPKVEITEMDVDAQGVGKFDFDIKEPAKYTKTQEVDEEASAAFSTKIQVWLRGGKEETWTGLLPSRYYTVIAKGSGGTLEEPLWVQDHDLTFNKELIGKIINPKGEVKEEIPPALQQIMDDTGVKTVAEARDIQERLRQTKIKTGSFRYDPKQGKYVSVTEVYALPKTKEQREAREKLIKAVREKYNEEWDKATEEARERHEKAQRGELGKFVK